jgi:magnesium and cobalt transporter
MANDEPPSSNLDTGKSWFYRLLPRRSNELLAREEISEVLASCRHRQLLGAEEYAMLQGVLEVAETRVREIMVPRSQMVVLEQDDAPEKILKTIVDSAHSRFPVIGEDRDQVVGTLLAKDLLRFFAEGGQGAAWKIDELLRPAVFIPESKRLDTLLSEFRESHNHMAIVVDEYGGIAGLATIEDVLEQIVGDIDDEHDPEEAAFIQAQDDGRFIVRALTRMEDFNEHFAVELNDEEYDTVGGLVIHELGRLPRRGERLEFGGFRFKVLRADRRRVDTIEVVPVGDKD